MKVTIFIVIIIIIIIIINRLTRKSTALGFSRQFPLVLLVKVGWQQSSALGNEEKVEEIGRGDGWDDKAKGKFEYLRSLFTVF